MGFIEKLTKMREPDYAYALDMDYRSGYTANATAWYLNSYNVHLTIDNDVAKKLYTSLRAMKYKGQVYLYFNEDKELMEVRIDGEIRETIWTAET